MHGNHAIISKGFAWHSRVEFVIVSLALNRMAGNRIRKHLRKAVVANFEPTLLGAQEPGSSSLQLDNKPSLVPATNYSVLYAFILIILKPDRVHEFPVALFLEQQEPAIASPGVAYANDVVLWILS